MAPFSNYTTTRRLCTLDSAGKIIAHDYRQTLASEGPQAVIGRMLDDVRRAMAQARVTQSQVAAVGIGVPGPFDTKAGAALAHIG